MLYDNVRVVEFGSYCVSSLTKRYLIIYYSNTNVFTATCVGHMLNILPPTDNSYRWLDKIRRDICRAEVEQSGIVILVISCTLTVCCDVMNARMLLAIGIVHFVKIFIVNEFLLIFSCLQILHFSS